MAKYKVKIANKDGKGFIETFNAAKAAKEWMSKCSFEKHGVTATYLGNVDRKHRESLMVSFGLTKVKGAVSGKTYWE